MESDISVIVDWVYNRLVFMGGAMIALSLVGVAVVRILQVVFRRSR